jgi:hypothetical protein
MEMPNLHGENGNYFPPLDILIDALEKQAQESSLGKAIDYVNKINAQFYITLPLKGEELPKKLRTGDALDLQYKALCMSTGRSVVVLYEDGVDFYQLVQSTQVETLEKAIRDKSNEGRIPGVTIVDSERFKKAFLEAGISLATPPALIVNNKNGSTLVSVKKEIIKEFYKANTRMFIGIEKKK